MYGVAFSNPPLGSTTVVEADGNPYHFTAVLELAEQGLETEESDDDLVVELWYGTEGDVTWREARFSPAETSALTVLKPNPTRRQKHFHLDLDCCGLKPLSFTIRFRRSSTRPWFWASNQGARYDGRLLFRSSQIALQAIRFSSLFDNTENSITISESPSQVAGTTIYNVIAPVSANSTASVNLGTPINMEKYYALVKVSSPWIAPRHGGQPMSVIDDGLLTGFLRSDGTNVVVLGLAAVDQCTTYIRADSGGIVELKTRNDGSVAGLHRAVVAVGLGWQETLDAAFYRARELISGISGVQGESDGDGLVRAQWKQEWYDGLAYCTWNGLGRELTEQKILDALQDLVDNGIKVSALIIDDNWQSLISRKWDKFEADPTQFPRGLKATVTTIKQRFPHITHIAVWHAIFGYWDGVAPGGWVDQNYKCETLKWHGGWDVRVITAEDVGRCYDDFYRFLADCGVDGVKTDVQASQDELDNGADRYRITKAYQDAFKLASMRHFGRKVIYCMAMQPYILLYSLLSSVSGQPPVIRNSDDFFPNIPSSHMWHIFANSYNNLYTSHLNALPDWDMFQSSLPDYGSLHAAARCISGGPIYITDTPGQHDVALIQQMSATTPQGGGLITLRPSRVANVTNPLAYFRGPQLLRVGNFVGGKGGDSLMAVFNTAIDPVTEVLQLKDFPGTEPGENYIVRAFSANTVVDMGSLGDAEPQSISLTLEPSGWEFFTVTRVTSATSNSGEEYQVGTLGLMDKMAGSVAVIEQTVIHPEINGAGQMTTVAVRLKALGVLGLYVSNLPDREISDLFITIDGTPVPVETVRKGSGDTVGTECIVYFDVEKAWAQMGLQAPWSGEVEVHLRLD